MHRIDSSTAQTDKFGAGKNGFTDGDKATGRRATDLNADAFDAYQEEICSVIESTGVALDKSSHTQLVTAIKKIISTLALARENNLSDVDDVATSRKNLELDKVGNYAAVQSGGGLHAAGNVHRINIDWDDAKLQFTVDDTDQGAIFTTSNPPTAADTNALPLTGGDLTGYVNTSAEIRSTHDDNFRMVNGDRGTYWRLDANNLYLMKTASGDQYGSYDDTRPIRVDLATGDVYINEAMPYSSNNPPPAQDLSGYIHGDACNQAGFVSQNADDPYMMYGGNTIVQLARLPWVNQNFITAVRLGSERVQASTNDSGGMVSLGGGELFTGAQGVGGSDFNKAQWRVRQLQYLVNGQWVAAGSI